MKATHHSLLGAKLLKLSIIRTAFIPLLWVTAGYAITMEPGAIKAKLEQAELVAEVQFLTRTPRINAKGLIETRYSGRILEVQDKQGSTAIAGDVITIDVLGGEAVLEGQQIGMFFSGYPRPSIGQRYLTYLTQKEDGYLIAGLEFGLQALSPVRQFSRNRTDGSDGAGDGSFLFWSTDYLPIPYYISVDSFEGHADYIGAIDSSFKTWRNVLDAKIEFTPSGCTFNGTNRNDGLNNIVLVKSDWAFDPDAIAITRNFYIAGVSPMSGLILDSDILLNDVHHDFTTTNEANKHDVQNIVTHEIGHLIGLGHETGTPAEDSTMYAQASPNELTKRVLKSNDLSGLRSAYAGVSDKPSTLEADSPSCVAPDTNAGCASSHSAKREQSIWFVLLMLYLLTLPRLYRRVTASTC